MKILTLVPIKPNIHPQLNEHIRGLMKHLPLANSSHTFDIVFDSRGSGDEKISRHIDRCNNMATVRQGMIDDHLADHDAVFWFDADIIKFPLDLPTQLINRGRGGISAPVVVLDGHPHRMYDIAGFVEKGQWSKIDFPWFRQLGPIYELDSVGACYLVPAKVYRDGGRHEKTETYTEHWSICQKARHMGLSVLAFADLVAVHADLNNFGEKWHVGR